MKRCFTVIFGLLLGAIFLTTTAHGHGVIGKRFIPSTLTIEDPFPSDEMDLLRFQRGSKNKEGRETSVGFEFSKRLTPDFALGVGWEYLFVEPREADARRTLAPPIRNFPLSILSFEVLNTKVYSAWG